LTETTKVLDVSIIESSKFHVNSLEVLKKATASYDESNIALKSAESSLDASKLLLEKAALDLSKSQDEEKATETDVANSTEKLSEADKSLEEAEQSYARASETVENSENEVTEAEAEVASLAKTSETKATEKTKAGENFDSLDAIEGSNDSAFKLASGELPPGVTLNSNGELVGTPSKAGTYTVVVEIYSEALGFTETRTVTLEVAGVSADLGTAPDKLAFTGIESEEIAGFGVALIGLGGVTVLLPQVRARRRREI